jgi:excisionase family DNA binding protein
MENSLKLFNIDEAADMLRVSPWTIRAFIRDGKLNVVKIGRRVLLERSELERLVEAGRKERCTSDAQ